MLVVMTLGRLEFANVDPLKVEPRASMEGLSPNEKTLALAN